MVGEIMMSEAVLVLETGEVFPARRFGAGGEISAELVFTTAMVGYVETLTDPSYHGQIVVQTFPLIGNYGVMTEDFESAAPRLSAYIVRQHCDLPSNYRSETDLDSYLKKSGVIGLYGVDTRALTRIIRERGVMNAAILEETPKDIPAFCEELSRKALSADVSQVTCGTPYTLGDGEKRVALWDFGFKRGMAQAMVDRGYQVTVVPAHATSEEILSFRPNGVLLSNGPGDPAVNHGIIREIRKLAETGIPIFGICLGHQLMALAMGAKTEKLKYGHRGANQPVRDLKTGRLYITSQNHGYQVVRESLPEGARTSFENANDGTNEGVEYDHINAFSVQFHPEARGGPLDTSFLFDQFALRMEECAHAAGN
jgi:carbamoyl-phosphate synthase small subunit